MALYDITRTCGHKEQVQIYGTNTRGQREWRAARLAEEPCADCRRAAHQQRNAAAAQVAAQSGLPALTGSERQIAWAESIRLAGLAQLADHATRAARAVEDPAARERVVAVLLHILTRIASAQTDARWWIDHRHRIPRAAWDGASDADRRAVQAAEVEPQPLDEPEPEPETPPSAQAAIGALRARGWTVAKIAAQCGVHRSTAYRWQSGQRTPTARNAAALTLLTRS